MIYVFFFKMTYFASYWKYLLFDRDNTPALHWARYFDCSPKWRVELWRARSRNRVIFRKLLYTITWFFGNISSSITNSNGLCIVKNSSDSKLQISSTCFIGTWSRARDFLVFVKFWGISRYFLTKIDESFKRTYRGEFTLQISYSAYISKIASKKVISKNVHTIPNRIR